MEIRQLRDEEFEQAIQLSTNTFRDQGHTSMGVAFPQVFSKELKQSFGAFDGGKLISFIGLVPANIRIGEAMLTVFSIGSVCTHESYRNRGIATTILKEIYRYIDQAAASLLFVSGDRGMYMRNHCYHFGKVNKYSIGKIGTRKGAYEGVIRKGLQADIFQIDRLKREKNVRFESSIWEWQVLLESSGYASIFKMKQELYVVSREEVIVGYAVIGMPTPSSAKELAIVTEWGGDSRAVYEIVLNLVESDAVQEIELTVPWHEEFCEKVRSHSCKEQSNGGTIHIVDAGRLLNQLMPFLKEKNFTLAESLSIQNLNEESVILHYSNGSKITLTLEELVILFFNPQEQLLAPELQTIFPIPLPNTKGMYFV